ncbi:hypothetical protein OVA24_08655 [Luteolibacter sp. SL250]|uniref:hypothetical protein n=1 Tax=Luteolibacter sp. SL250 TaxID=2995170 RepID=UPI00226FB1FC|nr:hypothetical protein [Luteolibacter sp. SL250]WAC21455.1 hypothetical protein OVA24_08655 [Luteolibacter sp. SL250]
MKTLPFIILCTTAPLVTAQPDNPESAEVAKEGKEKITTIAEVLGKPIKSDQSEALTSLIFTAMMGKYAKEKMIDATDEEVETFLSKNDELGKSTRDGFIRDKKRLEEELKSTSLSDADRKKKEEELAMAVDVLKNMDEETEKPKKPDADEKKMAREFVRTWKVNRALFKQYGGRVIFQQAGPEPVDAYRDFLREEEAKGSFKITDEESKKVFWKYFTDGSMHTFLDAKEGAQAMETPWWLKEQKPE